AFHRRAKTANRPPARPCQHTCRPPSSAAATSWLNDGPSVSLTGSGSLHRPSTKRQAHTPTAAPDRPKTSHGTPSAVTAAVGRKRSSGLGTTTVAVPSTSATSRSPRSSCHSSQAITVVAPRAAMVGRDALRLWGRARAVPRSWPASRGAFSSTAAALASWAGICPSPSSTHMYRSGSGSSAAMVSVTSTLSSIAATSRWLNASTMPRSARCRSVYSPRWWSAAQPCPCPCAPDTSAPLPYRASLLGERPGALPLVLRCIEGGDRREAARRDPPHGLGEGQALALPLHLLDRREHQRRSLGQPGGHLQHPVREARRRMHLVDQPPPVCLGGVHPAAREQQLHGDVVRHPGGQTQRRRVGEGPRVDLRQRERRGVGCV